MRKIELKFNVAKENKGNCFILRGHRTMEIGEGYLVQPKQIRVSLHKISITDDKKIVNN